MSPRLEIGNPYVGLRPYHEDESLLFFGRREQTAELLERLQQTRFLAVVGGSGCGKSSLILAGLIPALHGGFLVEDRDRWAILTMRPGDGPVRNLAAALCEAAGGGSGPDEIQELCGRIEDDPREVEERVAALAGEDRNVLLLVDQFEEIFSFRGKLDTEQELELPREDRRELRRRRSEASDFVDLILRLSRIEGPFYVVITMRTDFLGDCDVFNGLPQAVNLSGYLVPPLDREQLRQTIEGPARLSGTRLAPRLRDLLLNKLGDRPDRLPVLQHTLLRTWDIANRDGGGDIDLDSYRAAGTLMGGLSQHANEALRDEDAALTATLFKCLTDTDSDHRRVRRPVHMSELAAVSGASPGEVEAVLQRFNEGGRNFLVISDRAATGDPRVDISHESLIRQWDLLKQWVDEERDSRDQYLGLVERARKRDDVGAALLQDIDLDLATAWWDEARPTQAWARRYSTGEDDFELARSYLAESSAAAARARQLRRQNRFLLWAAIAVVIVMLAVATLWANRKAGDAEEALQLADLNLASLLEGKAGFELWIAEQKEEAGESPAEQYQRAWLYTLAALNQAPDPALLPESRGRLLLAELSPRTDWRSGIERVSAPVVSLGISESGMLLAGTVGPKPVDEERQRLGVEVVTHGSGPPSPPVAMDTKGTLWRVAFSPKGDLGAAGLWVKDEGTETWRGKTLLWRAGEEPGPGDVLGTDSPAELTRGAVSNLAFSGDGGLLASASAEGDVIIWNTENRSEVGELKHPIGDDSRLSAVAFSPADSADPVIATGDANGSVHLWTGMDRKRRELKNCEEKKQDKEQDEERCDPISALAFGPLGRVLAVGTESGEIILWDVVKTEELSVLPGGSDRVSSLAFGPSPGMFASGHKDGAVRLWAWRAGVPSDEPSLLATVQAHGESVESIVFAADASSLFSGSKDRTVRRIDLRPDVLDHNEVDFRELGSKQWLDESLCELGYGLEQNDLIVESREIVDRTLVSYYGAEKNELEFKASNLELRSTGNKDYPAFEGDSIILTPDQQQNRAGVVFLKADVEPPFQISFEYSAYNEQYPDSWYSKWRTADGLVLMFLKDFDEYVTEDPPAGGKMGFIGGSGYGVRFRTFGERAIEVFDGKSVGRWLSRYLSQDVYTGGEWREVTVDVGKQVIVVTYQGKQVLSWEAGEPLATEYQRIGFGAATGDQVSEHRIRNVTLQKLEAEPVVLPDDAEVKPPVLAAPKRDYYPTAPRTRKGSKLN